MAEHPQHGRAKEIFQAALDMASPEERFGYMKEACGADAALLARVQALLRAHEATALLRDQPAADEGSKTVWSAKSGWKPTHFPAHRRAVSGIAFTPDGHTLATGGTEGTAKLWDLATHREIVTLKGHLRSVHAVDISPDGSRLATAAGGAESLKLWDMRTHQELITLASESAIVVVLVFTPDGNKMVGYNDRGRFQIWRAPSWAEIEAVEKRQQQ